jgi:hypothetical protein
MTTASPSFRRRASAPLSGASEVLVTIVAYSAGGREKPVGERFLATVMAALALCFALLR